MIKDGKMSFYEAIVLLIRERAMVVDDNVGSYNPSSINFNNNSDTASIISKIGGGDFIFED